MRVAAARALAVAALGTALATVLGQHITKLGEALPPFLADSFNGFVAAAAASCEILPLDALFSRKYTSEMSGTQLVEVTTEGRRWTPVGRAHELADRWPSGGAESLLIYVPGWFNTPQDKSSETLIAALLRKYPVILILDTTEAFGHGYVTSASKVKSLAHLLFGLIQNLNKRGFSLGSIDLLGFSLGSHVVGMTGRLVQKRLNRKLPSITAMDPAQPCFGPPSKMKLSKNDAKFVQVIHTSAIVGTETPMGHMDVYANGVGVVQPECANLKISLECDHAQAWRLYSASVLDDRTMVGRECPTWEDLKRGTCNGKEVPVGFGRSPNTRGLFLYRSPASYRRSGRKRPSRNPFDLFNDWFT